MSPADNANLRRQVEALNKTNSLNLVAVEDKTKLSKLIVQCFLPFHLPTHREPFCLPLSPPVPIDRDREGRDLRFAAILNNHQYLNFISCVIRFPPFLQGNQTISISK
jgi:hypothetical protein